MNGGRAFIAGVIATAVVSAVMVGLRAVGLPLHIEASLAALVGTHISIVGFLLYLLIGGAIAILYAFVFEFVLNQAGVGAGLMVGACNTIAAGFIWSLVNGPGRFWEHFGAPGIAALFLVHFLYGAVVGALYRTEHKLAYF